jgi:hypothetical protein
MVNEEEWVSESRGNLYHTVPVTAGMRTVPYDT